MDNLMDIVSSRDPFEKEFHQAVTEVFDSVKPVLDQNPAYRQANIMEPMKKRVVKGNSNKLVAQPEPDPTSLV